MNWKTLIIGFLIVSTGIFYYILTGDIVRQEVFVVRVFDGDTFEIENGMKVRLKGVNTPEGDMFWYEEARDFLKGMVENKSVGLEVFGSDKYGRILGYVFFDGENVNKGILERGFGSLYYYGADEYYDEMFEAEESARVGELGIWKRSSDYGCVVLEELKFDEPERLVLRNDCGEIDVVIKDDATHIYREKLGSGRWEMEFSHIWNDAGDSLYVWGGDGLLVFWRY